MRPADHRSRNADSTPQAESTQEADSLPPAISSALEQGSGTLRERLQRIGAHSPKQQRYTLLGLIAEGGMGRILRVWDEVLQRELAMKVASVKPLDESSQEERANHDRRIARFIEEARVTGQLDHPGIVPVHEMALDADGKLYFTMPLVRGQTLSEILELVHSNSDGWTLRRALDILHKVCMTVAFAHSRGVIHRDLKPDNIMVGPFGETYVVDWGLALIEGRDEKNSIVGTPAYMAPEQATNTREVGPRSDVYSIGAILYKALSGSTPHQKTIDASKGVSDLDQLVNSPPRSPDRIAADIPPELLAVCRKAMRKDPSERYAGARELASDLLLWLEGRDVAVYETTSLTRLLKWRKRNQPLALALEALVMLALASVLVVALVQRGKLRAVNARNRTIEEQVYSLNMLAADLHQRSLETRQARSRLEVCPENLRGWEWDHLDLLSDPSTETLRMPTAARPRFVAVNDRSDLIAAGADDGSVHVLDGATGKERTVLVGHAKAITAAVFQPGNSILATASQDATVRLWDAFEGRELAVFRDHDGTVLSLAFSADGKLLASGDSDGVVHVRSHLPGTTRGPAGGEKRRRTTFHTPRESVFALAFEPSGDHLLVGALSGRLKRFHLGTQSLVGTELPERATVRAFAFSPDGEHLFAAYDDQILDLHPTQLVPIRSLAGHSARITSLAMGPAGRELLSGSLDGTVRLWDVETGIARSRFFGHLAGVNSIAFMSDGQHFVSGSGDRTAKIWSTHSRAVVVLDHQEERVLSVAFQHAGELLATSSFDRHIRIWNANTGELLRTISTPERASCLAWTPEGALVFSLYDSDLRITGPVDFGSWRSIRGAGSVPTAIAFDRTAGHLFARYMDGTVHKWHAGDFEPGLTLQLPEDSSFTLAVHPDGGSFAMGAEDGTVIIRKSTTGEVLWRLQDSPYWIRALAYGDEGRLLAAGTTGHSIFIWSTETGKLLRVMKGLGSLVMSLTFSGSGDRLFSGFLDGTVRVWDPTTGEALLTLRGHADGIEAMAFDPLRNQVASASWDGTVRLWRTRAERDSEATSRRGSILPRDTGMTRSRAAPPETRDSSSAAWSDQD